MVGSRKQIFFGALTAALSGKYGRAGAFSSPSRSAPAIPKQQQEKQEQQVQHQPSLDLRTSMSNRFGIGSSSTSASAFSPLSRRGGAARSLLLPTDENRKNALRSFVLFAIASAAFSQRHLLAQAFMAALEAYKSALDSHPLPSKALTGGSLAVIGDSLAQFRDATESTYDVTRAASFAAFDSCYRMFQHVAFPLIVSLGQGRVLYALFGKISSDSLAFATAMERTILYQFGAMPFFYYPVFFTFTGLMQGLSMKQTFERAKGSFLPCWARSLMFWIPTQLVMFGLVSEKWQIPFVCAVGIVWSMILSAFAGTAKE